ncbi:MAG: nitroreductase family protein [Victivallales bacterium]|nr:nitroreductase family protein [Victivallales bacterium]
MTVSLNDALLQRRTIRLYRQEPVPESDLRYMIDAARLTSCAANLQRLRFVVVRTASLVNQVLSHTAWAAYVRPARTPKAGESGPMAFVAVVGPRDSNALVHADAGAAIQSMQLAGWTRGLGCCWIGSVEHEPVERLLDISAEQALLYVLAVGYPAEHPVAEDVSEEGNRKYYLDEQGMLHVPKISLEDVARWL